MATHFKVSGTVKVPAELFELCAEVRELVNWQTGVVTLVVESHDTELLARVRELISSIVLPEEIA